MLRRCIQTLKPYNVRLSSWKLQRKRTLLVQVSSMRLGCMSLGAADAQLSRRVRNFSDQHSSTADKATFEAVCDETLDSLAEYLEELVEKSDHLLTADVNYSDGVLTVQFGEPYGTYVINRQTPNSQIWLSSPTSGPKRYDLLNNAWIYRHDGKSLHQLLDEEISKIVKKEVTFVKKCKFSCPS